MMNGYVRDDGSEAVIVLNLRSSEGRWLQVEAVIDTGFTATLVLPPEVIDQLDPPVERSAEFELADGRTEIVPSYRVGILWHGEGGNIRAYESGSSSPLIGMGLLAGSRLVIDGIAGGEVSIEKLTTQL